MKFLIDENADSRLIRHLTGLGHDARFIVHTHGQVFLMMTYMLQCMLKDASSLLTTVTSEI